MSRRESAGRNSAEGSQVPAIPIFNFVITELKDRIRAARVAAGRAVNRELVMLYWDIGRGSVKKQKVAGWGDAVVLRSSCILFY